MCGTAMPVVSRDNRFPTLPRAPPVAKSLSNGRSGHVTVCKGTLHSSSACIDRPYVVQELMGIIPYSKTFRAVGHMRQGSMLRSIISC